MMMMKMMSLRGVQKSSIARFH